ncbi:hypothetical protein XENTR_v10008652 [Xenopus tropicalis]|nr:hypothetical protein XENTR_v10008652 [Xenopus tropicalis]
MQDNSFACFAKNQLMAKGRNSTQIHAWQIFSPITSVILLVFRLWLSRESVLPHLHDIKHIVCPLLKEQYYQNVIVF